MNFNAEKVKNEIIDWIAWWFDRNGSDCNAVVGISGGKDSAIVAALCVEALGKNRVVGVMMPNGEQQDLDVACRIVEYLGISHLTINIESAVNAVLAGLNENSMKVSLQTAINLPARIRMTTLYAVSQSAKGRVANTCNLSEDYVGYATRYGDSAGDFSPLSQLTVTEVKEIGLSLGLPKEFVFKVPIDGLCGKTDEDNLGFTYDTLDRYIRTGICEDSDTKDKIDAMHINSKFKLELMPSFPFETIK
jgi:NAD+ synthase